MSYVQDAEERAVAAIASDYRSRGYSVISQPSPEQLPAFLGDHQPDLIATSPADSVVVKVKVGSHGALSGRYSELAQRVASVPGWRLEVVSMPRDAEDVLPPSIDLLKPPDILSRLRQAEAQARDGSLDAAFLLYGSAVEAMLRILAVRNRLPLERLPTNSLLRELVSQGLLSREHYESARQLLDICNSLSHGYAPMPGEVHVEAVAHLAAALLNELDHQHSG